MSADSKQAETVLKVAVLWGLMGCSGVVAAQETNMPDLEFLEYLGSWEESDEDWVLLTEKTDRHEESDQDDGKDPAPDGETLAELDDEI
jgi:hypothetical protein